MSHTAFINDLSAAIYGDDVETLDLSEFQSTVQGLINKHLVSASAPKPIAPGNDAMMTLFQQLAGGVAAAQGETKGKKGPKKGSISNYQVFLYTCASYEDWKIANPDTTYRDFQASEKARWESGKTNDTLMAALTIQRDAFSAWRQTHSSKKFPDFMKTEDYLANPFPAELVNVA